MKSNAHSTSSPLNNNAKDNYSFGRSARATNPFAIIADASDNLYQPDVLNHCIIKEDASTPAVSPVKDNFKKSNLNSSLIGSKWHSNQYYF